MVLDWIWVEFPLQSGGESLPQVGGIQVFIMSDGRMLRDGSTFPGLVHSNEGAASVGQ